MTPEAASLIGAGIAALASLGVAVVGVAGARSHKRTRDALADNTQQTAEVLDQVKNDHGTNLRDDLDGVAELVARHEQALTRIGSILGTVSKGVRETAKAQREHDAASLLVVEQLHTADRALAQEMAAHHPPKD